VLFSSALSFLLTKQHEEYLNIYISPLWIC